MTIENRIIISLDDLKAVTFECNEERCRARVTLLPDNIRLPEKCPQCGHNWLGSVSIIQDAPGLAFVRFCDAIGEIRRRIKDGGPSPFTILLEYEAQS